MSWKLGLVLVPRHGKDEDTLISTYDLGRRLLRRNSNLLNIPESAFPSGLGNESREMILESTGRVKDVLAVRAW